MNFYALLGCLNFIAFIIFHFSYFLKSALLRTVGSLLCYPYVFLSLIHIKRSTETEGIPSKVLRWKEYLDLSEKTSQEAENQNGEKLYDRVSPKFTRLTGSGKVRWAGLVARTRVSGNAT